MIQPEDIARGVERLSPSSGEPSDLDLMGLNLVQVKPMT